MVIHKPLQTHPPKCEVKSLLSIADPPVLERDPIFAHSAAHQMWMPAVASLRSVPRSRLPTLV